MMTTSGCVGGDSGDLVEYTANTGPSSVTGSSKYL